MIFSYGKWMGLPIQERILIANRFGIAKTGSTHVSDNKIVQDGFDVRALENTLTDEMIRSFLGIEEINSDVALVLLVEKINKGEEPKEEKKEEVVEPPKKRGRKPKAK